MKEAYREVKDNELYIEDIAQSVEEYDKIIDSCNANDKIAEYYDTLARVNKAEGHFEKGAYYDKRAFNIRYCHKTIYFDHFKNSSIKAYSHTFHCRDRFCPICSEKIAHSREHEFSKVLDLAYEKYDLFHLTLTMRNCCGSIAGWNQSNKYKNMLGLKENVKLMSKCFQKLIRYLSGNAKIRGVDFSQYGYGGAIRSFEVTCKQNQIYHPHYHVILALKKGVELPGKHYNDYSWDNITQKFTSFTDLEVLIQKIWYLILNGQKVTKIAIDNLDKGYSCRMRVLDKDDYHQTFKYTVKPDSNTDITFEMFQDLTAALYNMRTIQCYGFFHGLNRKLLNEDIDDNYDALGDEIIRQLKERELPEVCCESPVQVRENIMQRKCLYISPKSIRTFIKKYGLDNDFKLILGERERVKEFIQLIMQLPIITKEKSFRYLDGGRPIIPKQKNAQSILKVKYTNEDIF